MTTPPAPPPARRRPGHVASFLSWLFHRRRAARSLRYSTRYEDIVPQLCDSVRAARDDGTLRSVLVDMRGARDTLDALDAITDAAGAHRVVLVC